MMTKEQSDKYVENGGAKCPYCNSEDISGGFVEIDTYGAWQPITCNACNKSWRDLYKLIGVEEVE